MKQLVWEQQRTEIAKANLYAGWDVAGNPIAKAAPGGSSAGNGGDIQISNGAGGFTVSSPGQSSITALAGMLTIPDPVGGNATFITSAGVLQTTLTSLTLNGSNGSSGTGSDGYSVFINGGNANGSVQHNGGNIILDPGDRILTGIDGNIAFNSSITPDFKSGGKIIFVGNGTADPASAPADGFFMYGKDSSLGAANATFALWTEQAVEVIGAFAATHKLRIWINGVEYHIQLDQV